MACPLGLLDDSLMFKQLYTNMCQSFIFRLLEEIKPLEGLQGQCKDFKL